MFSRIIAAIRFLKYNTHSARIEAKTRKVVIFGLINMRYEEYNSSSKRF